MMRRLLAIVLSIAAMTASPAFAGAWNVDYAHSRLGFAGHQGGASFEGGFRNFQAAIDFDPAHPENGKITASIDIASATAGDDERDAYLPQSDWFDAKQFPKAEFTSTAIRAASAPSCYEASGNLTIKGIAKPVTLPFCLTPEGDHMRAQGNLTLLRNDFHIGAGQWSGEGVVANAVTVTVDIRAKAI
jgi:polyisoprenoid-binding protein YceI